MRTNKTKGKEEDKKQVKLFTKNENHAKEHNDKVARLEVMAREFVANDPEFELRVLDNAMLTKVCMALEARTAKKTTLGGVM